MISLLIPPVLAPLVGARVFADAAPAGTTAPWAVYASVDEGSAVVDLDGPDPLRNARVRIDLCASTPVEAEELAHQARLALYAALRSAPVEGPISDHDKDVGIHRSTCVYSVWYQT